MLKALMKNMDNLQEKMGNVCKSDYYLLMFSCISSRNASFTLANLPWNW